MDRFRVTKMVSCLSIFGNLFLLIIKGIIGFISGSNAMIADAFNSAGDILTSFMTFIGNKISSKEADDDHHMGHGKAEYIYSLLISVVMIYISFKLIISSIGNLFNDNCYSFSIYLIIVCVITIVVKFGLFLYSSKLYSKYNNILLKSISLDHRNDCFLTGLNLVSICFSYYGFYYFDSLIGIIISLWIIYSSFSLFKQSYDVLMDKAMGNDSIDKVMNIIFRHEEIIKVNHFNTVPVGYQYQISFTIFVDGSLSTYESHDIANMLEKEIDKEVDEVYLAIIHVNPL